MTRPIYNGYQIVQTIIGQKRIVSLHNGPDTALRAYRKIVNSTRPGPKPVVTIYWFLGGKRHELTPTQLFLKSSESGTDPLRATTQGE